MNYFLKFILIISIALISGCKNNEQKISIIEERDLDLQMIDAYNEGINFLDDNYPLKAAKKFNEAELLYPQSLWAPRSSLMSAYSYYYGSYYIDAIEELERFIEIYPKHERIIYAYYLLGMCHYEQIADEKKDLGSIVDAKQNFKYVIINYPDSDFALDSQFKLDLIQEILASKEMYLARYYIEKEIIDFLEIDHIRNLPVAMLPYGLQKRVELGRALSMKPKLILLDEPVAGMNREEKEDIARFILDIKEEKNKLQAINIKKP